MLSIKPLGNQVISPRLHAAILASEPLRRRLLPESPAHSPYEVLDYQATFVLLDSRGHQAVFHRTQRIRFLQDGVQAILDHFWGDGVPVTTYQNSAGSIGETFKDEGKRHLVIDLKQPARRGDVLSFDVERTAMVGFTESEEWLETTIDHPIQQLTRSIVFPQERPCKKARLVVEGKTRALRPIRLPDGRTLIKFKTSDPKPDTPYTVHWSW